jgi:O-antigen/teichoic acid export membrane protein
MTAQPLTAQPVETIQQAQPAPVVHQPMHTQTQMVYVHKPLLESMFGQKAVAIMVMIGVILTFVGAMLSVQAAVTEKVSIDNRQDKQVSSYTQYKWGATLMVLGIMFMTLFMLGAAAMGPDTPVNVKVGFLIFCAIMIFVTTTIVLGYATPMMLSGPTIID